MLRDGLPLNLAMVNPQSSGMKPAADLYEMYVGAVARQPGGFHIARMFVYRSLWVLANVAVEAIRVYHGASGYVFALAIVGVPPKLSDYNPQSHG